MGHVTFGIRTGHTVLQALGEGLQRSACGLFVGTRLTVLFAGRRELPAAG